MAKRGADSDITRETTENDDHDEENGMAGNSGDGATWKAADPATLARRSMVKVKRKGVTEAKSGTTAINWGAPANTASTAATVTKDTSAESKVAVAPPAEKKTKTTDTATTSGAAATTTTSADGFGNAFAKFLPKPGQWDCPHCYVRNEKDVTKCRACELEKDEVAPTKEELEAKKAAEDKAAGAKMASLFGGGAASTSSSSSSPPARSLSGTSPPTSAPAFGFGLSTSSSSSSGPSFSFGSKFGTGFGGSQFTFGSVPAAAEGNGFAAGGAGTSALEAAATLTPEIPTHAEAFKDKKAEASGEESDEMVYKIAVKVYQFKLPEKKEDGGQGKFSEAGSGELHLNVFTKEGKVKARMVCRAAQTQRLVLNAPLFPEMTHSVEDKWVKFYSIGLDGEMTSYALRLRNKAEATEVDANITKLIERVKGSK